MSGEDPVPLKAGGDAAPELVSALYALGAAQLRPERVARLAQRLASAPRSSAPAVSNKLRSARPLLAGIRRILTGRREGL